MQNRRRRGSRFRFQITVPFLAFLAVTLSPGDTMIPSANASQFQSIAGSAICGPSSAGAVKNSRAVLASTPPPSTTGRVVEFDIPDKAGSTHEITVSPDGHMWVTQQKQDRLMRITLAGEMTFHDLPNGSGPHGIGFDAMGRLWITLEFANEIAQIGPNGGIVSRHPIPTINAGPHGLAVAKDGTVWWTGKEGGVVGRLHPDSGTMDVYPLADPGAKPIYISQGPDGDMWVTELEASSIGRVTQSGDVTSFPLPTPNARPIAVFPGPDGNLWFTEERGNAYGTITTDGTIVEYPTNVANGELAAGAFDKMGNLWIQFFQPDIIQRIARDGKVTTYPLKTLGAGQHRITPGPGGNMWFTELAADKVGYVIPK